MLRPRRGEAAARGHCKPFSSPFRILLQTRACCAPGFPPFIIIFKITVMMGGGSCNQRKNNKYFQINHHQKVSRSPPGSICSHTCNCPVFPSYSSPGRVCGARSPSRVQGTSPAAAGLVTCKRARICQDAPPKGTSHADPQRLGRGRFHARHSEVPKQGHLCTPGRRTS